MSLRNHGRQAGVPRMLLTRQEAAAALGMSLRHFQRHVQPFVPCVYSGQLAALPAARPRAMGRGRGLRGASA